MVKIYHQINTMTEKDGEVHFLILDKNENGIIDNKDKVYIDTNQNRKFDKKIDAIYNRTPIQFVMSLFKDRINDKAYRLTNLKNYSKKRLDFDKKLKQAQTIEEVENLRDDGEKLIKILTDFTDFKSNLDSEIIVKNYHSKLYALAITQNIDDVKNKLSDVSLNDTEQVLMVMEPLLNLLDDVLNKNPDFNVNAIPEAGYLKSLLENYLKSTIENGINYQNNYENYSYFVEAGKKINTPLKILEIYLNLYDSDADASLKNNFIEKCVDAYFDLAEESLNQKKVYETLSKIFSANLLGEEYFQEDYVTSKMNQLAILAQKLNLPVTLENLNQIRRESQNEYYRTNYLDETLTDKIRAYNDLALMNYFLEKCDSQEGSQNFEVLINSESGARLVSGLLFKNLGTFPGAPGYKKDEIYENEVTNEIDRVTQAYYAYLKKYNIKDPMDSH